MGREITDLTAGNHLLDTKPAEMIFEPRVGALR